MLLDTSQSALGVLPGWNEFSAGKREPAPAWHRFGINPLLSTRELCVVQSQGSLGMRWSKVSHCQFWLKNLKERDVNGSFQFSVFEPTLIKLTQSNCCSSEKSPRWLETLYFCICCWTIPPGEGILPGPQPYRRNYFRSTHISKNNISPTGLLIKNTSTIS